MRQQAIISAAAASGGGGGDDFPNLCLREKYISDCFPAWYNTMIQSGVVAQITASRGNMFVTKQENISEVSLRKTK